MMGILKIQRIEHVEANTHRENPPGKLIWWYVLFRAFHPICIDGDDDIIKSHPF